MIRQALRKNLNRVQVARTASIPAPTLGWNATDSLAAMKPGYAVILDNWIPRASFCELRQGSRSWATGATHPVRSILVYRGASSGVDQIFGVTDGGVYNNTAEDSDFSTPVQSGLSTSDVQFINFANDGGAFLLCATGGDTPFHYDGTSWSDLTITGSSGSITLDADDLIDMTAFKRRIFWVEKESKHVWYLDVDAIQGASGLLDLGPVFQQGGTIIAIGSWSLDGGQGQDDYLCIFSTQGEVAVYQGTDPTDANYWSLVGVFSVGAPISRRCLLQLGSDVAVITQNGIVMLSQALKLSRSQDNRVALTQLIQNAFQDATALYKDNFGWEIQSYYLGSLALVNIPTDEDATADQYVQNLQTGAWCRFTGLNAICWAVTDDQIFFGTATTINEWNVGVTDAGTSITADVEPAFQTFGAPGRIKHFTMLQPVLNATANMLPAVEMAIDFQDLTPTATPTTIMDRSTTLSIRKDWTSVVGVGVWGAPRMRVIVAEDSTIVATLDDGAGDDVVDGSGNLIAIDTGEPLSAIVQLMGFNVAFQEGGVL